MQTTASLSTHVLKKAIDRYYKQLQDYKGRADYELAVRTAFLNLLNETAHQVKWMLIPEQTIDIILILKEYHKIVSSTD